MLRASWLVFALASVFCAAPKDDAPPKENAPDTSAEKARSDVRLAVEQVASGLDQPVYLSAPASDPRVFIVELPGRIRVVEYGRVLDKRLLYIVKKV
jgi:glucose/arabinose dehydrogenase